MRLYICICVMTRKERSIPWDFKRLLAILNNLATPDKIRASSVVIE